MARVAGVDVPARRDGACDCDAEQRVRHGQADLARPSSRPLGAGALSRPPCGLDAGGLGPLAPPAEAERPGRLAARWARRMCGASLDAAALKIGHVCGWDFPASLGGKGAYVEAGTRR